MRSLDRARYLHTSNFGRRDGWYVELDGDRVGELTDPRAETMFWDSYAVTVVASRPTTIFDDDLWNRIRFVFRNRATGDVVTAAFCGGTPPFIREGRVRVRGLYLTTESRIERFWLKILGATSA